MLSFIAKRICWIPISVILVSLVCFFMTKLVPYDPVDYILNLQYGEGGLAGDESFYSNEYASTYKNLGLDKPVFYFSMQSDRFAIPADEILSFVEKEKIKQIINAVVVIAVVVWLLKITGLWDYISRITV